MLVKRLESVCDNRKGLYSRYYLERVPYVARSVLIFGLHVHIGIESHQLAVELMNQLRTWLPHLLAISTNSPCWAGRLTGLKSYRSVVWKPFPRSGVLQVFSSASDFDSYVWVLVKTGELLDFVDEVIVDLGSRHEIDYLRRLLADPRGTGADRQIALYEQTGSMDAVIQLLIQQTMEGIPVKVPAHPVQSGRVASIFS